MNRGLVLAAVVLGAVLAAAYLAANAGGGDAPADAPDESSASWTDELTGAAATVNPFAMVNMNSATSDAQDANVQAWLATLQHTEGTDKASDPYAVVYGYAFTITDFSRHPADPKGQAWPGGLITRGAYAGKHSTAAGAYEFNWPTWCDAVRALGLSDFSPASQDAAAVWLTGKCGALDAVKAGDLATACAAACSKWASLPGSTAGQGGSAFADVQDTFTTYGGTLA